MGRFSSARSSVEPPLVRAPDRAVAWSLAARSIQSAHDDLLDGAPHLRETRDSPGGREGALTRMSGRLERGKGRIATVLVDRAAPARFGAQAALATICPRPFRRAERSNAGACGPRRSRAGRSRTGGAASSNSRNRSGRSSSTVREYPQERPQPRRLGGRTIGARGGFSFATSACVGDPATTLMARVRLIAVMEEEAARVRPGGSAIERFGRRDCACRSGAARCRGPGISRSSEHFNPRAQSCLQQVARGSADTSGPRVAVAEEDGPFALPSQRIGLSRGGLLPSRPLRRISRVGDLAAWRKSHAPSPGA